jgi:hypothetical protein
MLISLLMRLPHISYVFLLQMPSLLGRTLLKFSIKFLNLREFMCCLVAPVVFLARGVTLRLRNVFVK